MAPSAFNSSLTEASDIRARRMHEADNHRQARLARKADRIAEPRGEPRRWSAVGRRLSQRRPRWLALP